MKRRFFISLVTVALIAVTAVFFTACSQDEAEEDAMQSKVELLKAKAKEFAQKYGVEMSLNEDNLEELAKTLTVEQMEEDFKAFSEFKGFTFVSQPSNHNIRKGLKIQRTKTLKEEYDEGNRTIENLRDSTYLYRESKNIAYYGYGDSENSVTGIWKNFTGKITIECQYGNRCAHWVHALLDFYTGSEYVGGFAYLDHSITFVNYLMFRAYGNMSIKSGSYRFKLYVTAEYNGQNLEATITNVV